MGELAQTPRSIGRFQHADIELGARNARDSTPAFLGPALEVQRERIAGHAVRTAVTRQRALIARRPGPWIDRRRHAYGRHRERLLGAESILEIARPQRQAAQDRVISQAHALSGRHLHVPA